MKTCNPHIADAIEATGESFELDQHTQSMAAVALHQGGPPEESFDRWIQNPYTKIIQLSIDNDYVPKADYQKLEAKLFAANERIETFIQELMSMCNKRDAELSGERSDSD
jgi:hypothetical protein